MVTKSGGVVNPIITVIMFHSDAAKVPHHFLEVGFAKSDIFPVWQLINALMHKLLNVFLRDSYLFCQKHEESIG